MDIHPVSGPSRYFRDQLDLLAQGEMGECRLVPQGSNYTFLTALTNGDQQECQVIYKPQRGEAPLWDFPDGTLYLREYATYLVSEALGWGFVPPTVIRDGKFGIGSVQIFVEADTSANYFTLFEAYRDEMLRVCALDVVINNADRKASHCLLGDDGRIWCIDHGVTFHDQHKLRTVIWDFAGEPVPELILKDLDGLLLGFDEADGIGGCLTPLLSRLEVDAVRRRVDGLLESRTFPLPGSERSVPWPWL